eukprot:NODE_4435_length_1892_cov_4.226062.p1 GENE.NODE_4435_length_1892_cov_4.226062~~NODE_4435_length_1892_cov_4.226062.p1  ORF type:complete len:441 (+),score=122.47 NODE_4435_length_1892_cov_4.226062:110-1432(+)
MGLGSKFTILRALNPTVSQRKLCAVARYIMEEKKMATTASAGDDQCHTPGDAEGAAHGAAVITTAASAAMAAPSKSSAVPEADAAASSASTATAVPAAASAATATTAACTDLNVSVGSVSGTHYTFDVNCRAVECIYDATGQADLDRRLQLPLATLLKWMQVGRHRVPWLADGYSMLSEVEPKEARRLLVASQYITLAWPGALADAAGQNVTVQLEVGDIGRSSIEFRYGIFIGGRRAASASTVMVCVVGGIGRHTPSPVPDDLRKNASPEAGKGCNQMRARFAAVPWDAPERCAFEHEVLVRPSDEDVNGHANHTAIARFIGDAREAAMLGCENGNGKAAALHALVKCELQTLMVSYVGEVHAHERLVVKLMPAASGSPALDAWVYCTTPGPLALVARGHLIFSELQRPEFSLANWNAAQKCEVAEEGSTRVVRDASCL